MIGTRSLRQVPPDTGEGLRVLVSRRYPRGIRKSAGLWDEWYSQLGPSIPLLKATISGAVSRAQYRKRYLEEMAAPEAMRLIEVLALRHLGGGTLTLLCDHAKSVPDSECHRFLLKRLIEAVSARPTDHG